MAKYYLQRAVKFFLFKFIIPMFGDARTTLCSITRGSLEIVSKQDRPLSKLNLNITKNISIKAFLCFFIDKN